MFSANDLQNVTKSRQFFVIKITSLISSCVLLPNVTKQIKTYQLKTSIEFHVKHRVKKCSHCFHRLSTDLQIENQNRSTTVAVFACFLEFFYQQNKNTKKTGISGY